MFVKLYELNILNTPNQCGMNYDNCKSLKMANLLVKTTIYLFRNLSSLDLISTYFNWIFDNTKYVHFIIYIYIYQEREKRQINKIHYIYVVRPQLGKHPWECNIFFISLHNIQSYTWEHLHKLFTIYKDNTLHLYIVCLMDFPCLYYIPRDI